MLIYRDTGRVTFITNVGQGRSQDFSKGGSHCVESLKKGLVSYGQDIVMAFSPSVLGSLVKEGLQKGGSRAPQDPPCLRPCVGRVALIFGPT